MPGTEFKNQIDNLMNIMFGAGVASHATIIEQINYLVFLRSLSKKDDNAMILDSSAEKIFSGELAKYHWGNLLVLNAEVLFTTLEEIFRKLLELATDQTIRLLFRDAHVKIFDKPTLRRLVHEIEKMMSELEKEASLGHTDIFGDMYEYLLSKQAQAGTLGQFRTPRHIIKFIVDIIDPNKGETILDPACGTAGFLVSALEHLKEKYTSDELKKEGRLVMDKLKKEERDFIYKHTFTGFDSDFDMFKFGLMNLYLHKLEHPNIKRQNTLVDTAGDRTKWDIILANPPFAGALDQDSVSEDLRMGTRATEVLFLKYIIDHLSQNGRAGVIVPEGVVFNSTAAHKKVRQMLVEDAGLWCVVSLPSGVFNPYAGVKTSILFLDRQIAKQSDSILFVKIDNDGYDPGAQRREIEGSKLPLALTIIDSYKRNIASSNLPQTNKLETLTENTISIFVPKSRIRNLGDYYLTGERYRKINEHNNQKWPMVKLGDKELFEIESGGTPDSKNANYWNGKINWATLVDLPQSNLVTELHETKRKITEEGLKKSSAKLVPVDSILVSSRATIGRIAINKVESSTNQGFKNIIVKNRDRVEPKYIAYIMTTLVDEMKSFASGGTFAEISKTNFEKLEVPLPPIEVQKQIAAELDGYQKIIDGAKQVVDNWKPKIDIGPGWKIVKLGEVCVPEYGFTDNARGNGEARFIRITDISSTGELISENKKYINLTNEAKKYLLRKRDVLVARTGATFGKTLLFSSDEPSVFASFLIRLKFENEKILPEYYWIFAQSDIYWEQANGLMTGGGQPQFNGGAIKQVEIPLPPLDTQKQIVKKIEAERKLIESTKKIIEIYQQKIKDKINDIWTEK